jgi:outer membrane protein assembly factor BamB
MERGKEGKIASTIAAVLIALSATGCGGVRIAEALHVNPTFLPAVQRLDNLALLPPPPVAPPLTLIWQQDVSAGIGGEAPVPIDSMLLIGNQRGELLAIHLRDGQRIGSVGLGEAIHASPAVASGIAYISISGSRESLVAYDVLNGRTLWKQRYGDLQVKPLLLDGRLYFGNTAGIFYCVDAASGDSVWRFQLPLNTRLKGIRSSAAGDSTSVVFGGEDAAVYALDPSTGMQKWRCVLDGPIQTPVVIHGSEAFTATLRGTVYAIDRFAGTVKWSARTDAPVYARVMPSDSMIFVGATSGGVYAFAANDGRLIWKHIAAGPVSAAVAVSGSYVYFGTLKKEILALNRQDGTAVWRTTVAGRIKTAPVVTGGMIVFTTDEPSVMAFQGTTR